MVDGDEAVEGGDLVEEMVEVGDGGAGEAEVDESGGAEDVGVTLEGGDLAGRG